MATPTTPTPFALTARGAGCGCKLSAQALGRLLSPLEYPTRPEVLAGPAGSEDAGVFRLSEDLAIVQTADFFTAVVDEPRTFGRIAATNALSDIWAMGGEPVTALNLLAASPQRHGEDLIREVLQGGLDVLGEAGVALLGGHTIEDDEMKYGLAVTGTIHPARILRNATAARGHALVLTKPIGVGAIVSAMRAGAATGEAMTAAIACMCELNRDAARAAAAVGASALTDVTGFGLLGHLHELAAASGLEAQIDGAAVPALPQAEALIGEDRFLCGGSRRNRVHAETFTRWAEHTPEGLRRLLTDAVTSGGLLAAIPAQRAGQMPGVVIGMLSAGEPGRITVTC